MTNNIFETVGEVVKPHNFSYLNGQEVIFFDESTGIIKYPFIEKPVGDKFRVLPVEMCYLEISTIQNKAGLVFAKRYKRDVELRTTGKDVNE